MGITNSRYDCQVLNLVRARTKFSTFPRFRPRRAPRRRALTLAPAILRVFDIFMQIRCFDTFNLKLDTATNLASIS
eukprot:SAG31_NODE_41_length_31342_cov_8.029286_25_plen_76_part_00